MKRETIDDVDGAYRMTSVWGAIQWLFLSYANAIRIVQNQNGYR